MNKATIIIPIFNLKDERKINFDRILEYIGETNIPTIVVEQLSNGREKYSLPNKSNISHHIVNIESNLIHKSKLINEAAKLITTKYLWLLDADVYLKYEKIAELLNNQDLIKPFGAIVRLNEEETNYFLTNKKISFKKGMYKEQVKIFGPLSFIVKKELFDKAGGMNEVFKGYGWEDIEFAERISQHYELYTFEHINGLHLYHKKSNDNEPVNKDMFRYIRGYDPDPDNSIPHYLKQQSKYVSSSELQPISEKIDLSLLSIVITVKIDSSDRIRNLKYSVNYFNTFFKNFELIVIEHDENPQMEEFCKSQNCIYISRTLKGAFHKTFNFNLAISISKNPYIAAYDCDVIFNPYAIKEALDRLVAGKTKFIYPYNGYMVQINSGALQNNPVIDKNFIESLPYIENEHRLLPQNFSRLYGTTQYECTGGAFMFEKTAFFLCGGYNPNIVSYGCEDNELETRIKKLSYVVERLSAFNCYHLEHYRSIDSNNNNFFHSNLLEFSRIKMMDKDAMRTYIDAGFKNIYFDTRKHLTIVNTKEEFSVSIKPHKNDPLCSIIFTTYGSETKSSEEYLQRFKSWKNKDYELVVVVHDESVLHRVYLEYCLNIGLIDKLIFATHKHGHLRGVSLGIENALSDIIMVINNDVRISKEILDYSVARLKSNEKLGIVGWHYDFYEDFDGTFWQNDILSYRVRPDKNIDFPDEFINKVKKSKWYSGKLFNAVGNKALLFCNGSFLCTKRHLWEKIGGMNPKLFEHFYADDYYSYGVLELGYNIENIPREMRMSKEPKIFECFSDDIWKNKPTPLKGLDELTLGEYNAKNQEELLIKLIVRSIDDPVVVVIGDDKPFIIDIKYTKNHKLGTLIDVLILTEPVIDIEYAKKSLSSNGYIISTEVIEGHSFKKYGSLYVFFKNTTKVEFKINE